jgi:hypothetical protein
MGKCSDCRFWSEMVARATGSAVEALCLADGGPQQSKYMSSSSGCGGFKPGTFGAVDDPPNYGEETRRLYREAEGPDAMKAAGETP